MKKSILCAILLMITGCSDNNIGKSLANFAETCQGTVTAKAYNTSWNRGMEITCQWESQTITNEKEIQKESNVY